MDAFAFLPLYFAALGKKMAPVMAPEVFMARVQAGVAAMTRNDHPGLSCAEVFYAAFGEGAPIPEELLRRIDEFYQQEYPKLAPQVRPWPEAVALIKELYAKGVPLVLATDPLYPRAAIEARMAWGGLQPSWFAHLTSYEVAHHTKPSLAYFREAAAAVGVRPEACLMVGNDMRYDFGAQSAGMDGFYLEGPFSVPASSVSPTFRGSWADLHDLLRHHGTL